MAKFLMLPFNMGVVQWIELLVWDQVVVGLSPTTHTVTNMSMEIEKVKAYGIDFPSYVKYFITEIQDSIVDNNLQDGENLTITFDSPSMGYCYNGFELIKKTFAKKGYLVPIPSFKRDDMFHFTFSVTKFTNNIDSLPF